MATADIAFDAVPPAPPAEPVVTPRLIAAFVALSAGMFMAILDIQIVASSLTEIQAGLSASSSEISWVQTAYLVAEIVMIPLTGFLSRALSTRYLFAICRRRLHGLQRALRQLHLHRRDDRLARRPGLHRRRHDPGGLLRRLHRLPQEPHRPWSRPSSASSPRWRRPSARPWAATSPAPSPGTGCSWSMSCPASR